MALSLLPSLLAKNKHGWSVAHGTLCQRLWAPTVAQETLQNSKLEALGGTGQGPCLAASDRARAPRPPPQWAALLSGPWRDDIGAALLNFGLLAGP